jgi:RNA polymerase sigma-70 factor (ECF subfamily)
VTGLAETFLNAQRAQARCEDPVALSAAIEEIVDRARARWPSVELPAHTFAAHVADRTPDEIDPLAALPRLHAIDLYLACACARGDAAAIACFEREILPSAAPAIARIDRDPEFIREIVHEVRVHLLVAHDGVARIEAYLGAGPLTSWVQVVAMRTAYSQKRKKPSPIPDDTDALAAIPFEGDDAELARLRKELAGPFAAAFKSALAELPARERNVLRLYLIEGVSSEAIGRMYRVHRGTVARWIASIHETLLTDTKKRLTRELGLSGRELDSVMRLLVSKLEVSIATVLSR